jgi:hypothetical protein
MLGLAFGAESSGITIASPGPRVQAIASQARLCQPAGGASSGGAGPAGGWGTMRRAMQLLMVGLLAAGMALGPRSANAAVLAKVQRAPAPDAGWTFSAATLVHGAGALLGVAAYSYLVAPLAPAPGIPASTAATLLTGGMAGASLAAIGAVAAGLAYDRWSGQPFDYSYVWTRAGAVAGFGLASATAGWAGLPAAAATWSAGWFGYRLFLGLGALAGSRAVAYWYLTQPTQTSPALVAQPPGG